MMRTFVVYESMYGNTRQVAEAIADGLGQPDAVRPVADATPDQLAGADLIVVGGPTHMLGMSGPGSQRMAATAAAKPDSRLTLEPGASGPGIREWLATARGSGTLAAAFDTHLCSRLSGRASSKVARRLRRRGFRLIARPHGFLVGKDNTLLAGELDRAREWGRTLADAVQPASSSGEANAEP